MNTIDIATWRLAVFYGVLALPVLVSIHYRLKLSGSMLLAAARMSVQLVLVGIYLRYIFDLMNPWVTLGWLLVMITVANFSVLGKVGLRRRVFFWATFGGVGAGAFGVAILMVLFLIQPDDPLDPRYFVPLTGMILGNCLRGNVMALERFFSGVRRGETELLTYLSLGATRREALRPLIADALKATLNPMLATMGTMGIVSLPGMMTGQILGGSFPTVAIKYQIAVMLGIFTSMAIGAALNIHLAVRIAFDERDMLREDVFTGPGRGGQTSRRGGQT
jgi:putative ABC transport system permease protein